jgi:hypothetical protein
MKSSRVTSSNHHAPDLHTQPQKSQENKAEEDEPSSK